MKLLQIKPWIVLGFIQIFLFVSVIQAQTREIPSGYYDNAEGLSGSALKTALYTIIDNHTSVSYAALWTHFETTDKKTNGKVWDMYSDGASYEFNFGSDQCGNYSGEGDCYNREHSFPKSWFNDGYPMYTDMFHLYPTDGYVNGRRSNYPFGEVGTASWTSENGSKLGSSSYPGYTGTVFEPIDEYKGDFARSYFYMVTRYEDVITAWPGSDMLDGSKFPAFTEWAQNLLIEWSNNDPVSEKEIDRNEAIYSIQHNRNPFIDHPEYVAQIWGGNSPAIISNITRSPENPEASDIVFVSASISDAEGIASVSLHWGMSAGNLSQSITMTATGAVYTSNTGIPAQADGTTVYYQILVTDNESATTYSTVYNYTVGSANQESLVFIDEDFESTTENQPIGLDAWMNYMETGSVAWESLLYNSNRYAQITSYQSGEENMVWLITPAINLDLSQDEKFSFDVNVGYWKHNGLSICLSSDFDGSHVSTASWTDITSNFTLPTTPTNGYGTFASAGTMDLSSYNGTIYLAFKYQGNASGTNTNTTTYQIDNVVVDGIKTPADTVAPILTVSPENQSVNIAIDSTLRIVANETLRDASGNALTSEYIKSVLGLSDGNQEIAYAVTLADNNRNIELHPEPALSYLTAYTLNLASGAFSDPAGNLTTALTSTFTTKANPDTEAPLITIIPANQSNFVDPLTSIKLSADETLLDSAGHELSDEYVKSVIAIQKDNTLGDAFAYTVNFNNAYTELVLTPENALPFEQLVHINISRHAFADAAGNLTQVIQSTFTTNQEVDSVAPELNVLPADGSEQVALASPITLIANEYLLDSLKEPLSSVYIASVVSLSTDSLNGPSVNYAVEINASGTSLNFIPTNIFTYGQQVFVSIANHAFADAAGNKTAAVNTSFTTKIKTDSIAPGFLWGYPKVNQITAHAFNLSVAITETGKVYYLVLETVAETPALETVLNSNWLDIPEADVPVNTTITGLRPNTAYTIYLLTQDNEDQPNTAASLKTATFNTLGLAPEIDVQPVNTEICESFSGYVYVIASGTETLQYQWYKNNSAVAQSNNDTLFFSAANQSLVGTYRCKVSNTWGGVDSDNAMLTIIDAVYAGIGTSITVKDTVNQVNLFTLLSDNPTTGGSWLLADSGTEIPGGIFYPSREGAGTYVLLYRVSNNCMSDTAIVTMHVETLNSLNPSEKSRFQVYPNPSSGSFYLKIPQTETKAVLHIYTLDGRLVYSQTIIKSDALMRVSLEQKGNYIINLITQQEVLVQRVIVD